MSACHASHPPKLKHPFPWPLFQSGRHGGAGDWHLVGEPHGDLWEGSSTQCPLGWRPLESRGRWTLEEWSGRWGKQKCRGWGVSPGTHERDCLVPRAASRSLERLPRPRPSVQLSLDSRPFSARVPWENQGPASSGEAGRGEHGLTRSGVCALQWQVGVVATESVGPEQPQLCTVWSLTGKVCQSRASPVYDEFLSWLCC